MEACTCAPNEMAILMDWPQVPLPWLVLIREPIRVATANGHGHQSSSFCPSAWGVLAHFTRRAHKDRGTLVDGTGVCLFDDVIY